MKLLKLFLIFIICLTSMVFCDQRNFIWTYEKKMLSPGEREFELYVTSKYLNHNIFNNEGYSNVTFEYEFEIGMTDNLEVAFYNTFTQDEIGFKFDEYKLRFKYNIFNSNNTWTPLLYTEIKGNLDFTKYILEQKFIFTKYFNLFNLSFNPIIEFENEKKECTLCSGGFQWEREIEAEIAVGLSYDFKKRISLGLDIKSSEYVTYAGPVFAHGGDDMYWSFGLARKISGENDKPSAIIRSIMGFHF